jgi:hypothetical protein
MDYENLNITEIMESRRQAVEESLRTIGVNELKALSEQLFRQADHPVLGTFLDVINDPESGTFHHAHAGDNIQVLYCQNKDVGMWYIPGFATGRLEPHELQIMKEVVQAGR